MPKYVPKVDKEATAEVKEVSEGKGKGKGKGKSKNTDAPTRKPSAPVLNKAKALAQIVSLDENDDEREATSKKISWILRKGAPRVGITMEDGGWVKFSDLLNADLLEDVTDRSEEKLMSVIDESNSQKLRYELKDGPDGKLIRALKKEERKSKSGAEPGLAPGWKAGETKEPESSSTRLSLAAVTGSSELRGDAPAFVPAAQAAAAASTLAGYTNPAAMGGYPGFFNPYGYMAAYGYGSAAYGGHPGYNATSAAAAQGPRKLQGRIKSFNAEKGYGFIESPEAFAIHNRDVFLHKAHIGSLTVGTFITFSVETNKEGMPQARDITEGNGSGQAAKGKGKGKGKKDSKSKGDGKDEKSEKKSKNKKSKEEDKEKAEAEGAAAPAADAPAPAADAAPADAEKPAAEADKS